MIARQRIFRMNRDQSNVICLPPLLFAGGMVPVALPVIAGWRLP